MTRRLPRALSKIDFYKSKTVAFGGIDKRAGAPEGSLEEAVNMRADAYPSLASRRPLGVLCSFAGRRVYGFGFSEKPYYVAENGEGEVFFYYDGEPYFEVSATEKSFAVINGLICIFPDKKYFSETAMRAKNASEPYESLEALHEATKSGSNLSAGDIYLAGNVVYTYNPAGLWRDNLTSESDLKETPYSYLAQSLWNYVSQRWGELGLSAFIGMRENGMVKVNDTDGLYDTVIDFDAGESLYGLKIGDPVELKVRYRTTSSPYSSVYRTYNTALYSVTVKKGYYAYTFSGADISPYLDDEGNPSETGKLARYSVEVIKRIPDFDTVFVHDNRLWGAEGEYIHASAPGDPTLFLSYSMSAASPWSLAVMSKGRFTAGCSFLGYPTFFKEDMILRIAGSYPEEYTTYETADVLGVKAGEGKSLAASSGELYYTSREGVARYRGSYPEIVSEPLGMTDFSDTAAGAMRGILYFSAGGRLYAYDTKKKIWMGTYPSAFSCFFDSEGVLYALAEESNAVMALNGDGTLPIEQGEVISEAVTLPFYSDTLDKKGAGHVSVLLDMEEGAWAELYISYDGGEFKKICRIKKKGTVRIPIALRRCGQYRIKIKGTGIYELKALEIKQYDGSRL